MRRAHAAARRCIPRLHLFGYVIRHTDRSGPDTELDRTNLAWALLSRKRDQVGRSQQTRCLPSGPRVRSLSTHSARASAYSSPARPETEASDRLAGGVAVGVSPRSECEGLLPPLRMPRG